MRRTPRPALLAILLLAPTAARAGDRPVRVSFHGHVDAELAALITSELAANGWSAYVVLEAGSAPASGEPVLEVHLEVDAPYVVAQPSAGTSSSAPISSDDPEAAALGAVSLMLERAVAPPPRAEPPPALAAALARPLALPSEPPRAAPRPAPPRRGLVIEVGATTGVVANGGSAALGAFLSPEWLVLVHGSALHVWPTDGFLGRASASLAYVARMELVDLELGLEGGLLPLDAPNGVTSGALLGGFAGVAAAVDPAAAVLVRLGFYAGELEGSWVPALLLTVGARITP